MSDCNERRRGGGYLNGVLTVIACLLVVLALRGNVDGPANSAFAGRAADSEGAGIPNAAAQRREMINAIEKMDGRLQRVEKTLNGTMRVEVVSMPAIEVREE